MISKRKIFKISYYILFFFIFFSILLNFKNFKGLSSVSQNLLTIQKHSQLYHFSTFFSENLTLINKGIIIYYPLNQKQLTRSFFLKKFWGSIPDMLLSPTVTKQKQYNSEISFLEFKFLESKVRSYKWFRNQRKFSYVFLSEAWKEEKNWAVYEYVKNNQSFIYLLPLNWRQNLKQHD